MKLLYTFSRHAPNRVFVAILIGVLAGISYALLIPLLLSAVRPDALPASDAATGDYRLFSLEIAHHRFAGAFALLCASTLLTRLLSQTMLLRVSIDVASELRTMIYARIVRAPLSLLEGIGESRLITILSADVPQIVAGGRVLPDFATSTVTLIGLLAYIFFLNESTFWMVLGAIAFGVVTFQIPMFFGRRYFMRSRQGIEALQESIRGLIHGIKELKLARDKREDYFQEFLHERESVVRRADKTAHTISRAAINYGDLLGFFVIGVIAFVFVNYETISTGELIGVIVALLCVTGPVAVLLNAGPQIVRANVSLRSVTQLLEKMLPERAEQSVSRCAPWSVLRLRNVSFTYGSEARSDAFEVGPINLEIRRGQITFIVGGNGSGKSTLGKMLTLHYRPCSGELRFDDRAVDDNSLNSFREEIWSIHSNFYLFERLLGGARDAQLDETARQHLRTFGLEKKVSIENGRFSTLALSDGQRRRLALIVGLLEDRPLYLFDEWAADQDPQFKRAFYHEVLPQLRQEGKAVVVITHDDRYFEVADQLVAMDHGKIVRVRTRSRTALEEHDVWTASSSG